MASPRHMTRIVCGALLGVALAFPALALATGNTIKINAPHTAQANVSFKWVVKGYSASKGNKVAIFTFATAPCQPTYAKEKSADFERPIPAPESKGSFIIHGQTTQGAAGTYYFCVYLYKKANRTRARASSKYQVS